MSVISQSRPFVIGVDCHARTHTYAVIDALTGQVLACEQFPAAHAGLCRALSWVARRTGGDATALWVIEGIGTYGAGIARVVADAGYDVVEAPRMNARGRRGTGSPIRSMRSGSLRESWGWTSSSCAGLDRIRESARPCGRWSQRASSWRRNAP